MFILILGILIILLILLLLLGFRVFQWTIKSPKRIQAFLLLLAVSAIGIGIHHFFFKNMQFIQSEVYPNLYLVDYPDKDYSVVEEAIKEKIKEHLSSDSKTGKPLSYTGEKAIYFYELGGMTFGFLGEAGTGYFIDHEEDLGGFVSEELGMYQDLRLAEFYYEPCPGDPAMVCGEINFFREGEYVKLERLEHLSSVPLKTQDLPDSVKLRNNPMKLPFHGVLDIEAVAKYYPKILNEFDSIGNFFAQRIPISNDKAGILSLLRRIDSATDYFVFTHDQDFQPMDSFYLGKAMDFDQGKSVTLEYEINSDSSVTFHKVQWGPVLQNNQESIDTLSHETIQLRVNQSGKLEYTLAKNPKFYALEVYGRTSDSEDISLRNRPNGRIIQALDGTADGYLIRIISEENGWFRVLSVKDLAGKELKIQNGFAWIAPTAIGIRTNREALILDSPQSGKPLGKVPMDTDLTILDIRQDWVQIEFQGLSGWVDSQFLCGNPVSTCP